MSCTPHGILGHTRWADSSLSKESLISQIARRFIFFCALQPSHIHLSSRPPLFMTLLSAGCRFVADGAFPPVQYLTFDSISSQHFQNPVSRKCAPLDFSGFQVDTAFGAPACQPSVKVRPLIQILLCFP